MAPGIDLTYQCPQNAPPLLVGCLPPQYRESGHEVQGRLYVHGGCVWWPDCGLQLRQQPGAASLVLAVVHRPIGERHPEPA